MRREKDALRSLQRFFAGVLPEPWDVRTELEAGEPPERPFALIEQAGGAETSGAPAGQQIVVPMTANLYLERRETREDATDAALDVREQVWQGVKWGADPRRPATDRIELYSYEPRLERHRFKIAGATGGTFRATVGDVETGPLPRTVSAADLAVEIEESLVDAGELRVQPGDVVGYDRGAGLWDVYYAGSLAGERPGEPGINGSGLTGPATVSARTLLQGALAPWRGPSDYMRVSSFSQNTVRDTADPALVMVAVDLRLTFVRGRPLPLNHRILQRVDARP